MIILDDVNGFNYFYETTKSVLNNCIGSSMKCWTHTNKNKFALGFFFTQATTIIPLS